MGVVRIGRSSWVIDSEVGGALIQKWTKLSRVTLSQVTTLPDRGLGDVNNSRIALLDTLVCTRETSKGEKGVGASGVYGVEWLEGG